MDKSYIIQFQKKAKSRKSDLSVLRTSAWELPTIFLPHCVIGTFTRRQRVKLTTSASDHQLLRKQTAGAVTAESQSATWGWRAATFDLQPFASPQRGRRPTVAKRSEDKRWLDLKQAANGQIRKSGWALAFPCREIASKIAPFYWRFFFLICIVFLFIYSAFNEAGYCRLD